MPEAAEPRAGSHEGAASDGSSAGMPSSPPAATDETAIPTDGLVTAKPDPSETAAKPPSGGDIFAPSSPPASVPAVAAIPATEETVIPEGGFIPAPLPPLEPATEEPPATPPPRRRFDRAPGSTSSRTWRRHWIAAGGLAVMLACLIALNGSPFPTLHWPGGGSERPIFPGPTLVIIDPGHGGGDTGAVAQGVVEKDLNLDVGRRVAQTLTSRGVNVRLTREDDHFITLEDRVRIGNSQPGAIFVSIHFNDASGDGRVANYRASGIETFYSEHKAMSASAGGWMWASLFGAGAKADPAAAREVEQWSEHEGATLAQWIQTALVGSTSATDRGIKERSLYVTRRVRGPAVLVEGGFVSHPAEARLLGDPAYRQKLADAIADGIVRYLDGAAHQTLPAAVITASLGA